MRRDCSWNGVGGGRWSWWGAGENESAGPTIRPTVRASDLRLPTDFWGSVRGGCVLCGRCQFMNLYGSDIFRVCSWMRTVRALLYALNYAVGAPQYTLAPVRFSQIVRASSTCTCALYKTHRHTSTSDRPSDRPSDRIST